MSTIINPVKHSTKSTDGIGNKLILPEIWQKSHQQQPTLLVEVDCAPISTLVMLHKSDRDITENISTMLNQTISIKGISKPNVSLTKVGGLHISEDNILLIGQEIYHYCSDGLESYLMRRHRVDGDDGQVLILGTRTHQNHSLHWLPRANLQMIEPTRDKRRWVYMVF